MSAINRLHKTIIYLLIICFVCVFVGSIDVVRSQNIGLLNNTNLSLLTGFTICLLCFLLVWKIYRLLDALSEKGCFWFSIIVLIFIAGIFTVVSFSARVTQFSDAFDVIDTAFYLRKHVEATEELPYIQFVESFGNNYPVILFESFLIKILEFLGFHDIEIVLMHLNIIVLMAAIVLTWLIVKETRGIKAAAKTAVLCLLNPYLYLIVNWTYSMTYSLPIMMGILYIALRLKKVKTTAGGVALAITDGLLIGGGFLIRPTTVFPLIAAGIVWFPSFFRNIRKKLNRKRIIQILCIVFAAVLVIALVNNQVDRRFGRIKPRNLPLSFWTLLGSHDDGIWNGADFSAVRKVRDSEDIAKYALDQTVSNYRRQGADGTLNLWYRKLVKAWADGGFFYRAPAVSEGNSLSEYFLGNGARNQLTKIYCQAFRLFMIMGFLVACGIALMRRNLPEIVLIMIITIFGCVAFHTIWETNTRYDIPFVLPMLVAVGYGIPSLQGITDRKISLSRSQKRAMGIVLMGFLVIVCSNLNTILKEKTTLNFYRIFSSEHNRVCAEIKPGDFQELTQDFYTDKPFNSLYFRAAIREQKTKEESSGYILYILNDEGKELRKQEIFPDQIGKTGVTVSFDTISGYSHYQIRLIKKEPEKESILLYTQYTYGEDSYRGTLTVDDSEPYPNDVYMDVFETQETTVFSDKVRIAAVISILMAGAYIAFVPVRNKRKLVPNNVI